ncbi:anti-sigma factor antagonist [Leptospira ognonensis]|uniref:Anti-sigma factor antagonist n=1 Tax=Leptospira ognonensis TaxID=2484945 RepID=A0A4R9JY23_9LEPT|nr:STAS domain-containing protein [Leptospira ognonensis]TGL58121.1 anti-sigma factor antagonist [Leptospira ognonensis]
MIRQTQKANVLLVEAKSLDILCMGGFEKALEKFLVAENSQIFLDFGNVEEVSSAILGIILHKKMKLRKKGIEIYLLNVTPGIQRILKILNLTSLLLHTRTNLMYASAIPMV